MRNEGGNVEEKKVKGDRGKGERGKKDEEKERMIIM